MRRPVTLTARSNRPVRDERGTILVITVVAMLLLAVLALSFSMVATLEGRMGVNYHGQVKALHVADAGIEGIRRELEDTAANYFPLDPSGTRRWIGTWKPVLQALGTICDGAKQVVFNFGSSGFRVGHLESRRRTMWRFRRAAQAAKGSRIQAV